MKKDLLFSEKRLRLAVLCGLMCAIFACFAHFSVACDELRTNVLRLHIIANSDSETDQELKLKIRDRILENSIELFSGAENAEQAEAVTRSKIPQIEEIARQTALENGFDLSVKAELCDSYFETREYDDFTLPAGVYRALKITLGRGEGKNWWCVIFPEVCLPAAFDASLSDSVSEEGVRFAEGKNRYIMRFWAVEEYEKIKKFLRK